MPLTMKAISAGAGARSARVTITSAVMPAVSAPSIALGATARMASLLTPTPTAQLDRHRLTRGIRDMMRILGTGLPVPLWRRAFRKEVRDDCGRRPQADTLTPHST